MKVKRLFHIVLCFILVVSGGFVGVPKVMAAATVELSVNTRVEVSSKVNNEFTITSGGSISITSYAGEKTVKISQINSYGRETEVATVKTGYNRSSNIRIPAGRYSFKLLYDYSSNSVPMRINFSGESSSMYEQEFNDSYDTACTISNNILYTGNLHSGTDVDNYRFVLDKPGRVKANLRMDSNESETYGGFELTLYSEDSNRNVKQVTEFTMTASDRSKDTDSLRLPSGTYFVRIKQKSSYWNVSSDYQLKVITEAEDSSGLYEREPNDSMSEANTLAPNTNIIGSTKSSYDKDYFKVRITEKSKVQLRLETKREVANNAYYVEILKDSDVLWLDSITSDKNPVKLGMEKTLEPGIYYVRVRAAYHTKTDLDYKVQLMQTPLRQVSSIQLSADQNVFYVGDKFQLRSHVSPADATKKTLTYKSNDKDVVTVTSTGKVTCKGAGEAIITAKSTDGSQVEGLFRIKVNKVKVKYIEIDYDYDWDEEIVVGDVVYLDADVYPSSASNKSVTWRSSDKSIATVNSKGKVTFLDIGEVSITVTSKENSSISETIDFEVMEDDNDTLSSIKISAGKLSRKFSPARTSYTLTLGRYTSQVKITPVRDSKNSRMTINGKRATSITVPVSSGRSKNVYIKVKADSGSTRTYKIKVYRR